MGIIATYSAKYGSTTSYTYYIAGQMTKFEENGTFNYFSYDSMGNPVKYKVPTSDSAKNMVWTQGRKLASGSLNGNNFSYGYDQNGIRYKKTVNNSTTEYYLNGSQILAENRKGNGGMIYYIYDAMGVSGMIYNGNYYYFDKNTLGEVIAIKDSSGAIVATYAYDAWGNVITKSGSMADINPFRYRGYYYDTETDFYYLQSRYYDPSICRFISADQYDLLSTLSSSLGELNLYSYCSNNPICWSDNSGCSITISLIIAFGVGALIGGSMAAITGLKDGKTGCELFSNILGGALLGGVLSTSTTLGGLFGIGAISAKFVGIGLISATSASFGAGIVSYGLQDVWFTQDSKWNWNTVLAHGGVVAVQGAFSFGVGALMGYSGNWSSLNKEQFGDAFTSARNAGNSIVKSTFRATGTFLKNNIGQMLLRSYFKGTFATPWSLLRTVL